MPFELSTLDALRKAWKYGRCGLVTALAMSALRTSLARAEVPSRYGYWKPVVLSGEQLSCIAGKTADEISVVACRERCAPIAFQLDERGDDGRLVLDSGPQAVSGDGSAGVDANDEIVFMASDLGRVARAGELAAACVHAVRVAGGGSVGWAYVVAAPSAPAPVRYVDYDPVSRVMTGRRAAIGFAAATPRSLRLRDPSGNWGENLLDRLKIRAAARFFGILPLGRDEDDIQARYVAWRVGPVRVIRREERWVRLGFGLRTPIFRTETTLYGDYVELPVRLRLNFPPSYFFSAIEVRALLDFADLGSWSLRVPGLRGAPRVDAMGREERRAVEDLQADWVALQGPQATLVLALDLGPTLRGLDRRVLFRNGPRPWPPEALPGENPGLGFRLRGWGAIDSGRHRFTATSFALPAGYDLDRFARERREPWSITVEPGRTPR